MVIIWMLVELQLIALGRSVASEAELYSIFDRDGGLELSGANTSDDQRLPWHVKISLGSTLLNVRRWISSPNTPRLID